MKLSVKTRLGMEEPEEFDQLLDIYNRYPFEELILHPRVQKDYYKNKPRLEYFEKALEKAQILYATTAISLQLLITGVLKNASRQRTE